MFDARGGELENLDTTWMRPAFTEVEGAHGWLQEDGRLGLLPGHYRVIGGSAGQMSITTMIRMALFIGDRCVAEGIAFGRDNNTSALTGAVFDVDVEANLEIRIHIRENVKSYQDKPWEIDGLKVITAFIHLERLE